MKRFTWRQKKPLIQRRLDFWLISDFCQEDIEKSDIISSINSDHSAIILHFSSIDRQKHGPSFWKFNASLVDDTNFINRKLTSVASRIGLITVSDVILTGRQSGQKLQCLYGNPMAKNFFQNRILRNL